MLTLKRCTVGTRLLVLLILAALVINGSPAMTPSVEAEEPDKPGAGLTIFVAMDKMNAFREGQQKFWEMAADELGVEMILQVAGEDAQRQSSQIDTAIAQGVDGIVTIPWDYEAVLSDIERAHEAGIPMVTVDQAPADTSTIDFHSGADPYADGLHAGQRLVSLVGDEPCKVVDLQGALSHFNGQMRDQGFKDGIADHPNIEIISEVPTEWRPEPVLAGMENALQAHPDLCAVFAASDGFLPPIWSALEKVDRYKTVGEEGHVYVMSVDGDPQGCSSVKDGYMDAGYAQPVPKMTRDSFLKIIDIVNGVEIPEEERIQFLAGTEYMLDNIDETASEVWGCAGEEEKPGAGLTIFVAMDKMNAFREGQQKFWEMAADELGVEMILQVAGEDAQRQSSQIDTAIAQGVDGIVTIPWDYEAVLSDIERAHEAGIPMVTVDQAPADTSTIDFHSGADPYADGLHAGQRLVSLVGDEPCKVVDLQGALSHFNGQMRDQGFKDGIADHPNIEIISEVPTEWRPEPVLAGMENALQAHPDLCAVFAASDGFLPPIWSALEKVDRYKTVGEEGHVYVMSVDGDPQGCSSVKDGYMDAGYAQPVPKMTRDSFLKIIDIVNGVEIPEEERIQFIAGTEYMLDNIDETASQVWGCIE